MQSIREYLTALITEKGKSVHAELEIEGHIGLCYENLIEFVEQVPKEMQESIRAMLVKIDFKNGDVFHYLDHLVQGMLKASGY